MSRKYDGAAPNHGLLLHAHPAPTTQQILAAARDKEGHHSPVRENATGPDGVARVDAGDVAAIQNDDRLTAADRVDMIANQVLSAPGGNRAPETTSGGQ